MNESQSPATPPLPVTWTRKQVAASLQISERHLCDLEKEHAVPVLRAGAAVRYDKAAFDHLVGALRVVPAEPAVPSPPRRSRAPTTKFGAGYEETMAALRAAKERNRLASEKSKKR